MYQEIEMINSQKRLSAQQYRKNNEYGKAEMIYRELWDSKTENWDKWMGWEYADTLKKASKTDDAINISKEVFHKYPDFIYNKNLLCWLLYEKYIKVITKESTFQQKRNMLKISEFIVGTVYQDGKRTAFESTVFKVIDVLKSQNNVNNREILKWIEKFDYSLLSEEIFILNLNDGRTKEGASRKEEYFSIKTKALEVIENFEECLIWSNIAFEVISKFHYDNDIWIDVRRNYCIAMISKDEKINAAIQNLINLAERKKHWSIYSKIFDCYSGVNNLEAALKFGAKALLSRDPMNMKVTLLYKYALQLEKVSKVNEAAMHFALVAQIRKKFDWKISTELSNKLLEYKIDETYQIIIKDLTELWIKFARLGEKLIEGKIINILPHGNSGFISGDDGNNYFFRKASFVSGHNHIHVGMKVSFKSIKSFDPKKQKEGNEAIEIVIE